MQQEHLPKCYSRNTKMSDLICENYDLLLVITRFGIHLGFGEKSVGEVCEESLVNCDTLLTILNAVANMPAKPSPIDIEKVSIPDLVNYLSNSHSYFLDYRLPSIRRELVAAISNCPEEVAFVIKRFFDEYVVEVQKHMSYEEKTVFPYARLLCDGQKDERYSIDIFRRRHDQIETKISELKNILIKYYPAPSGYELNGILHDIFTAGADLASHNFVEDNIFIPKMLVLEQEVEDGISK